jgi:hypothetical protein
MTDLRFGLRKRIRWGLLYSYQLPSLYGVECQNICRIKNYITFDGSLCGLIEVLSHYSPERLSKAMKNVS